MGLLLVGREGVRCTWVEVVGGGGTASAVGSDILDCFLVCWFGGWLGWLRFRYGRCVSGILWKRVEGECCI